MRAEGLFDILIRQHADMLSAFIHSVAFDRTAVDDIFQETIITAWERIDDFDTTRPFGPWLRGIARNHILSAARKNRRYRSKLDDLLQQRIDEQFDRVDRNAGDTFAERMTELRNCMAALGDDAREAVDLVYLRGIDSSAAAKSLGTNEEAFRKRLYRARVSLAQCLRPKAVFAQFANPSAMPVTGVPE